MKRPPWLDQEPISELLKLDDFTLMGLEPSIDVDAQRLERHYLMINQWVHPDRSKAFAKEEQLDAANLCANANAAYSRLKSFRERGELLLAIKGGRGSDEDRRTPPGFLERVFHINELLDEHPDDIDEFVDKLDRVVDDRRRRIEELFGESEPPLDELRVQLNALKYEDNLLARAESLEEDHS